MAKKAPETLPATAKPITVELRREIQVGVHKMPAGSVVGTITVEAPFSANFLVQGMENGVCGEQVVKPDPEQEGKPKDGAAE